MMYVETSCTVAHAGHSYTAGGAVVTPSQIVAYLGKGGVLTDWHGREIGRYRVSATWRTPRSYMSSHMHQVEATVEGVTYTGRSCGEGMVYTGKRKAGRS